MASPRCVGMIVLALMPSAAADLDVQLSVDWDSEIIRTRTAATVEVDVMPFRKHSIRPREGGSFNAYYEALANLGSEFVRYAPWYPNPRVVVPELTPVDCTTDKPATNWNSTLFDGIMRDFMHAVCGPNAESGECKLSVVQQLSTMPSWMYKGGYCPDASPSCLPLDPWDTTDPFNAYASGNELVDKTCGSMARYMGRLVGWYTAGGFTDECGHFHESGLHYSWYGVSILNEDEHGIQPDNGQAYVQCYDAMEKEIRKQGNEDIVLVGPEIAGTSGHATEYLLYHLNASNHDPPVPPQVSSYHWGSSASNSSAEGFLSSWEKTYNDPAGSIQMVEKLKKETGQDTEMVLNEYIPFVGDWCDLSTIPVGMDKSKCPNWQDNRTAGGDPNLQHGKGVQINRKTWSWNAAAAVFAYGYGSLAMLGYKYVGQDQLIGGTWPDNEPAVSCMDWTTGQVNAKYWVINMLAMTVGTKEEKTIVTSNVTVSDGPSPPPPPKIGQTATGTCGDTTYSDDCTSQSSGAFNASAAGITTLAQCVAKVKTCGKNGNFASFSLQNEDCSWYASCDMSQLLKVGAHYETEAVTGKGATTSRGGESDPLFAMPYVMNDKKGILLVNKKAQKMNVTIKGAKGGNALVVEVATDGPDKEEPAFAPQIAKTVSSDGMLQLGPFGVAVVTELTE